MGSNTFIPKTTVRGLVLVSTGNGDQVAWSTFQNSSASSGGNLGLTWAQPGLLIAQTLPGPFAVSAGFSLLGAYFQIKSGTSVTAAVHVNGSGVTGLTGINITTSSGSSPITLSTPHSVTGGQLIELVLSSPTGSASGLTFTLMPS